MALQRDVVVLHPLHELEGPGAGAPRVPLEVRAPLLDDLRGDHHARAVRERGQERGVGPPEVQPDGVGVHHVHRVDVRRLALPDRLGVRLHAVEVELGGLGVEVGAVVELHPALELEDEGLRVGLGPGLGQAGLEAQLDVEDQERLVEVVVDLPVDLAAREVRVHGGRLDVEADPEGARRAWGRSGPAPRGRRGGRAPRRASAPRRRRRTAAGSCGGTCLERSGRRQTFSQRSWLVSSGGRLVRDPARTTAAARGLVSSIVFRRRPGCQWVLADVWRQWLIPGRPEWSAGSPGLRAGWPRVGMR